MLISCKSCKSKYLVNSADLKPNGRTVKCVKCGSQWFQDPKFNKNEHFDDLVTTSAPSTSSQQKNKNINTPIPNLPSTYVREQKVSILNSILVVLFMIILIGGFWIIRNLELNNFVLIKFYLDEFTFNLKLIFDDIAKIIHNLIN